MATSGRLSGIPLFDYQVKSYADKQSVDIDGTAKIRFSESVASRIPNAKKVKKERVYQDGVDSAQQAMRKILAIADPESVKKSRKEA